MLGPVLPESSVMNVADRTETGEPAESWVCGKRGDAAPQCEGPGREGAGGKQGLILFLEPVKGELDSGGPSSAPPPAVPGLLTFPSFLSASPGETRRSRVAHPALCSFKAEKET